MRQVAICRRISGLSEAEEFAHLCRFVGTGLSDPDVVNQGRAQRYSFGSLDHHDGLELATALFEVAPRCLPFRVELLEKHPDSEQLILPVGGVGHWIIVMAPDQEGVPDLDQLRAVRLGPQQGVIYARNVWHLPIFFEGDAAGVFLVQSFKSGQPRDCIELALRDQSFLLGEGTTD
ncbi:ureidoglycolate lyase [Geminicoccus roseus]|uniref:ureidoglycolate lyase n=1 Tax=Geminicoccus roseus TaxID=404900 RepID=UPI00146FB125|nr:ureidoglycolate lyase [Geminicoccus roseus]